jgi:hypothetical protein
VTKKLRPEERAAARAPLTPKMTNFIRRALSQGASPKAVAEAANRATTEDRATLRRQSAPWVRRLGETWEDLSGTRSVDARDVRRVYDSMRKSAKWTAANDNRKASLLVFKTEDDRRKLAERFLTEGGYVPERERKIPTARQLHDLGYARHFGASREELQAMMDELGLDVSDIPNYLLGEG